MPISWLDIILIVIMLISGFLAMVRGFTREVLSIFSWAMAAVAALYFTPRYYEVLTPYIDNPSIAQIAFAAAVFIVTLIIVSLFTFRIGTSPGFMSDRMRMMRKPMIMSGQASFCRMRNTLSGSTA